MRDIHNTLIPAPSLLWMLLSCTKAACANRFASSLLHSQEHTHIHPRSYRDFSAV